MGFRIDELTPKEDTVKDYVITLSFCDEKKNYAKLLTHILTESLLNYKLMKMIGVSYSNECTFYYNSDLSLTTCIRDIDNLKYISIKAKSLDLATLSEILTNITTKFVNLKFVKAVPLQESEANYDLYAIGFLDYLYTNLNA